MPSISVTQLYNFNRMKVTFSELAQSKSDYNFAGVVLEPDRRHNGVCSKCGGKCSSVHQTRSRSVRDIPLLEYRRPWVNFSYRMLNCERCGEIHAESNSVSSI